MEKKNFLKKNNLKKTGSAGKGGFSIMSKKFFSAVVAMILMASIFTVAPVAVFAADNPVTRVVNANSNVTVTVRGFVVNGEFWATISDSLKAIGLGTESYSDGYRVVNGTLPANGTSLGNSIFPNLTNSGTKIYSQSGALLQLYAQYDTQQQKNYVQITHLYRQLNINFSSKTAGRNSQDLEITVKNGPSSSIVEYPLETLKQNNMLQSINGGTGYRFSVGNSINVLVNGNDVARVEVSETVKSLSPGETYRFSASVAVLWLRQSPAASGKGTEGSPFQFSDLSQVGELKDYGSNLQWRNISTSGKFSNSWITIKGDRFGKVTFWDTSGKYGRDGKTIELKRGETKTLLISAISLFPQTDPLQVSEVTFKTGDMAPYNDTQGWVWSWTTTTTIQGPVNWNLVSVVYCGTNEWRSGDVTLLAGVPVVVNFKQQQGKSPCYTIWR